MFSDAISARSGKYKQMIQELDFESSVEMENLMSSGALVEPTPATLASWPKSTVGYTTQMNRLEIYISIEEAETLQ